MIELNLENAKKFLDNFNLKNYNIIKFTSDASFRQYYRILTDKNSYILMFAPPTHEDLKPFIKVDEILINFNLLAPKSLAKDFENGFLLLQDFGDDSYTKYLIKNPNEEFDIYKKACDVLIELHKNKINDDLLNKYNNSILFIEVKLFTDWYLKLKNYKLSIDQQKFYKDEWFKIFDKLSKNNQVLVLRDYHADNLMVLNNKHNHEAVGLLDFQDALIGSYAYDLLSLIEDARRDIDDTNRKKIFDYFISKSNYELTEFNNDYEIISLQRNIKILGIFARLCLRDNKKQYLDYIPRVKSFVENRLNSSKIISKEFKEFIFKHL
jgi:aminoglycoside/choline kinase family phosphotransferase